jgi:hypothetical protein
MKRKITDKLDVVMPIALVPDSVSTKALAHLPSLAGLTTRALLGNALLLKHPKVWSNMGR